MKKQFVIIRFLLFLLMGHSLMPVLSADQSEINIYENLNIESVSAYSNTTGNTIFDFIPMSSNDLRELNDVFISNSMYISKGDLDFVDNKTIMENIDFIKSFLLIWNHRRDFMPFIAYYTPYKSKLDSDLQMEIIKKQDVISTGIISSLGKNQIIMSMDVNYSTYEEKTDGVESKKNVIGLSNRVLLNFNMNKNNSAFIGATSPVYFDYILGSNDFDNRFDDGEGVYFNNLIVNGGLNYSFFRDWFVIYSATYREFDKLYNNDAKQINYRWAIEHKAIIGKTIDKNVRISLDYKLTPSVFDIPYSLTGYRHSLGLFLGYKYDNIIWNFYINDSTFLTEKEALSRVVFQMDLGYNF